MTNRYPVTDLLSFIEAAFQHHGVPEDDAATTAARMIDADLRGMSGHGIFRLPAYLRRVESGGYNIHPSIEITRETPVSALIDGDNGIGQVVVTKAAETAAEKATTSGLAWVGIQHSNHAGAGGVYAAMALEHDLIALYMAIGNANHMPPWGGVDLLLSTNPLAVAIPAGDEAPLVLDMATTVVSSGRIKVAAERGETLPEGWLVDRKGNPVTDATRAEESFLVPIGGYKGYGLNLVIGALAGVLNGAAFGSSVLDFNADFESPTNTGQAIMMMRPDLFMDIDEFKSQMDLRIRELRESTPMEGHPPIRVPGDQTPERIADMRANGVPLADGTVKRLAGVAERLGIEEHPFSA